jgi:peptidoglycan/LPS O-acetylase OafA/YrhL
MGEVHAPDRRGIPPTARAQAPAPARPGRFPIKPPDATRPRRRAAALPLVILSFIAMIAIGLVADALESGKLEEAIGPVIAVAFVAFMIVRQLRGRRS